MANFEILCKRIIDTNGNISLNDVRTAGYLDKDFDRLKSAKPEKLVKNARDNLLARGIHYKEVM